MTYSPRDIELKPIDKDDQGLFVALSTCAETMRYVYDPITTEQAKQGFVERLKPWQYESDGWLSFTVVDCQRKLKVGSIGLKVIDHQARIAEVGFLLLPNEQGKGYASAALGELHQRAFKLLGFNELAAICDTRNKACSRLLQRQGYTMFKRLENNSVIAGMAVDDYYYQLTHQAYMNGLAQ